MADSAEPLDAAEDGDTSQIWGGRFAEAPDELVRSYTASLQTDLLISRHDIAGIPRSSLNHVVEDFIQRVDSFAIRGDSTVRVRPGPRDRRICGIEHRKFARTTLPSHPIICVRNSRTTLSDSVNRTNHPQHSCSSRGRQLRPRFDDHLQIIRDSS